MGWHVCTEQFKSYGIGDYSYRPKWRSDASGAGGVAVPAESEKFVFKALDIAINWPSHTADTLGDLITYVARMTQEYQARVWSAVEKWAVEPTTSDCHRSQLRERVRQNCLTRRRRSDASAETRSRASEIYESLTPKSPAVRHGWLFRNVRVDESSVVIEDDGVDLEDRDERISMLRMDALKEILDEEGLAGVMDLVQNSGTAAHIGYYVVTIFKGNAEALKDVFLCCLRREYAGEAKVDEFIRAFVTAVADDLSLGRPACDWVRSSGGICPAGASVCSFQCDYLGGSGAIRAGCVRKLLEESRPALVAIHGNRVADTGRSSIESKAAP